MKSPWLLALAVLVALPAALLADKWAAPTPKVFASQFGSHGFKLLKPEFGGDSEGLLFRLDAEGREQIVWQAKLINTPHQVIVDEDGTYVVTVDTYGILGYAHSLVIYGKQGKVIR